ncbi:metallo-beta-lactamase class B [bacterium A37T11]|nr:metallo-beta-lactamase class B [bacterium A37T11]
MLIANLPTIVTDKKFSEIKAYPNIESDYRYTLNAMKKLTFDIWLSSHCSQFHLHSKHKPNDPYDPTIFMDKKSYDASITNLEEQFFEKIKSESAERK